MFQCCALTVTDCDWLTGSKTGDKLAEFERDKTESNRRYNTAFAAVQSHTTPAEQNAFWRPFGVDVNINAKKEEEEEEEEEELEKEGGGEKSAGGFRGSKISGASESAENDRGSKRESERDEVSFSENPMHQQLRPSQHGSLPRPRGSVAHI